MVAQSERKRTSIDADGDSIAHRFNGDSVKKKSTLGNKAVSLSARFVPVFWADADSRLSVIRAIRKEYLELREACGADSPQKDMLVQRAVFINLQLQTMEIAAIEGKQELDSGRFTQMVNALVGLLRLIGIERHVKDCNGDLRTYLEKRNGKA